MVGGGKLILISLLLYTITIGMNLFPPLFQQVFTDHIITGRNPDWFWPMILLYSGLFLLELVAWLVLNGHRRKLDMRFSLVSQARYIWHALRLPMDAHQRFSSGDLIARYMGIGTTGVKLFDMAPALVLLFNVLIFSYLLFVYHWKLGLIEIAALLTIALSIRLTMDYQKRKARSMEATERHLQSATMAGMHSMETIKAAGAEQRFYQKWEQLTAALLLCLGAWFILKGELTPGMLLASQGFMSVMLFPITKMSNVMQDIFRSHSMLERQEEVLDIEVNSEERIVNSEPLTGEIELHNVTFGYDRSMPPLIEHLSLHIKPGEQVAFVGKSGCGKSTLAMLVAGLYEPWEGEIFLDGKPISQTSRATLTGSIGVVGQDVTLFEGTIADNIRMWDESITDADVVRAATCAQLHQEITDMPNTYDSLVETGGQNFSSGQRQRLEIAAALAKQPTILILDEATATLDITTEAAIIQDVRKLGITLLMIAHRLETVRQCDTIYVIEHGHVIQHGSHDQLMADTQGLYYQLNTYGNDD